MLPKYAVWLAFTGLATMLAGCEREVTFSGDIQPIFTEYCVDCHDNSGEGYAASGFSVADYDSVMKGTNRGQVVVPGSSSSSTLYRMVAQQTAPEIQMPPHHQVSLTKGRTTPLPADKVETIRVWIDQGANNN